jgi:hypothetical protein
MKKNNLFNNLLVVISVFTTLNLSAQVGIGTTAPRGAVDVASTTQGFVLPTVSLAATNVQTAINPQGGAIPAGTVVYNDATAGAGAVAVTPGMYYWDGSAWVSLTQVAATGTDWTILGNSGTNANNNFIGTTDNREFRVRTNNNQVFNFSTGGSVEAYQDGSRTAPIFTWQGDTNTGMYRSGNDNLSFTAGSLRFLDLIEGGTDVLVINEDSNNIDFRVETNNNASTLFVDGGDDEVGMFTNNPQNDVHIAGNNTGIRIDAFSSANNVANNGVDDSVIYVDTNGDLLLKPSLTESQIPEDNALTFVPLPVAIGNNNGNFTQQTLYTSTFTVTRDALVEIVYQIGVDMQRNDSTGFPNFFIIDDGYPRQYGTAVFIDGNIVGYTAEAYTARGTGTGAAYAQGTYFLNGNGYAQLTGAAGGTTYTVTVIGFTFGGGQAFPFIQGSSTRGNFGGIGGVDRFQIITHY